METTKNIFAAMTAVMAEIRSIGKNRKHQQGYSYRSVDDFYTMLQPLFVKHSVFCVPRVVTQTREERPTKSGTMMIYSILQVQYTFYSSDGSYVQAIANGEAMDSSDKASVKAMSAALKAALTQIFMIPVEGSSPAHQVAAVPGEAQKALPPRQEEVPPPPPVEQPAKSKKAYEQPIPEPNVTAEVPQEKGKGSLQDMPASEAQKLEITKLLEHIAYTREQREDVLKIIYKPTYTVKQAEDRLVKMRKYIDSWERNNELPF